MSKRKGPTPRRDVTKNPRDVKWTPFQPVKPVDPERGVGGEFMYENSRYVVIVAVGAGTSIGWPGSVQVHLSIRRQDRGAVVSWRDLERIKAELVGSEAEGVEVFPASSRLMDAANQRHLFCTLPGWHFDWGLPVSGRQVADDDSMREYLRTEEGAAQVAALGASAEAIMASAKQAPFDDGMDYDLGHDGLIWQRPIWARLREVVGLPESEDEVEALPPACMEGTCACPSQPDGYDQHVTQG